jgi:hypothetical protein
MGTRKGNPTHSLVLWDSRFGAANLALNEGATLESHYTQDIPRPGEPVAMGRGHLVPRGVQEAPVEVEVRAAGWSDVARYVIDDTAGGQLTYLYQGHPRTYELLRAGASGDLCTALGACAVLRNGYPVVVYGGPGVALRRRYWTGTAWSSESTISGTAACDEGAAVVALPDLLVAWAYDGSSSSAWASDDEGATWVRWATDPIPEQAETLRRITAAYGGGGIAMVCQPDDSSGDLYQLVSADLGASFAAVATHTALGRFVSVFPLANGDIGIVYMRDSDDAPVLRILGNAAQDLTDADEYICSPRRGFNGMTGYCDVDGRIYVALSDADQWQTVVSADYGATWSEYGQALTTRATNVVPRNLVGVSTPFGAMVLHNSSAPSASDYDDSAHVLWLGGWSNLAFDRDVSTFGDATRGTLWLPWAQPIGGPWAASGAGTVAMVDGLALAGQKYYNSTDTMTGIHRCYLDFQVDSGGDLSSMAVGLSLITGLFAGSIVHVHVQLRASTAGIRVRDVNGSTTLGTITIDMTERLQVYVETLNTACDVWYRRPNETKWTLGVSGTLATAADTQIVVWGNHAVGAHESTWYMMGFYTPVMYGTSSALTLGRELPTWLPPDLWGEGAILGASGGPVTTADDATVPPSYDYPLTAALPDVSPSPDTRWRSSDSAAQIVAWDLGAESQVGSSIVLAVLGAEARTWALGSWNGATWSTVATLDLGADFTGLTYARTGDIVTPNTSTTADAARYIQDNELAGGYVILSSGVSRRILGNAAGAWVTGTSVVPRIHIELTGGEPSSGTCTLVCPGGYVVAHPSTVLSARYWRVRAVAQDTVTGQIGAGTIFVGRLHGLGAEPDWGWSDDLSPTVRRSRSPYGTPRTRALGPPGRTWSWSWGDGLSLSAIREDPDADYYGRPGRLPLVAADDVWWQLRGALETHQALPVLALRTVGADGVSVTDRTLWLYGETVSSVAARGMRGQEGYDEWLRLESLTIEEIR